MGILPSKASQQKTPTSAKRKSTQIDFSKLGPLSSNVGTKNFAGYRDQTKASPSVRKGKSTKKGDDDAMDSDVDEDDDKDANAVDDWDETEVKKENGGMLSPEDALRQGELAEGVKKMKVTT